MKNLFKTLLSASVALLISSCNQNSPSPSPATPSPTPTPTSTMTATEAALVGDWIWDKTEVYYNGVLDAAATSALVSPGYKFVSYKSTSYPSAGLGCSCNGFYGACGQQQGSLTNFPWYVSVTSNGNYLNLLGLMGTQASGYITTLTANSLIYQNWIPGQVVSAGTKYYYRK